MSMGWTWYIFAKSVFFDIRSLCSLLCCAVALARLNSMPMAVCLELSLTLPQEAPQCKASPSQTARVVLFGGLLSIWVALQVKLDRGEI